MRGQVLVLGGAYLGISDGFTQSQEDYDSSTSSSSTSQIKVRLHWHWSLPRGQTRRSRT